MGALTTTVHVPDNDGGYTIFGPDDDLPDWAAARIGAHAFEDGDHPLPDSDYPGKPVSVEIERAPGSVPARKGPGSSRDAWADFANEKGQEVAAGASRDDIIAGLLAAGLIDSK